MTTTTSPATAMTTPSRGPLFAALGLVAAAAASAVGTFWDVTGNDTSDGSRTREYLVVLGLIAVATALVFGLVVRTARAGNPGRRAVILGVLAVLTVVVAWTGFPLVLAAGAVACALDRRDLQGSYGGSGTAALVLAALGTAGAVVFAIAG